MLYFSEFMTIILHDKMEIKFADGFKIANQLI